MEMLSVFLAQFLPYSIRLWSKLPSGTVFLPPVQAGKAYPSLVADQFLSMKGSSHLRSSEPESRPTLKARLGARRGVAHQLQPPTSSGEPDMVEVWPSKRGSVCFEQDHSLPTLVLLVSRVASGCGCSDSRVAQDQTLTSEPTVLSVFA